ncbi:MAG: TolC family protein [Candidatus Hydrogenedentes bacterium]|nr:TolC family protein [Candidatus Hydrogenedentota bacterium]
MQYRGFVRYAIGLSLSALCLPVYAGLRVGMVQDGAWPGGDEVRATFQREIEGLDKNEFGVICPPESCVVADGTWAGVDASLNQLLANPNVDLVIALGTLASTNACRRASLPKPVIAPYIMDADALGIAVKDGASGKANLIFMASSAPFKRDLEAFRELVPFTKVAILGSQLLFDAVPAFRDNCRKTAESLGLSVSVVPLKDSIPDALSTIPSGTEVVYVGPFPQMSGEAVEQLSRLLIDRKLPSFSFGGRDDVERGILACINPPSDTLRLARRAALYIQRMQMGEKSEALPVSFTKDERLVINMATARALDVAIAHTVLLEAEVLNEQAMNIDRHVSLTDAVTGTVASNLEIASGEHKVAAGKENIRDARAKLLPKVDASITDVHIDSRRSAASAGLYPEHAITASVSFTQVIFAEQAWANLDAQKLLQRAREFEFERTRLDTALDAAKSYLNLLRAKTGERIRKGILRMSRSHLELARVRKTAGTGNPVELFRWENEIAKDKKAVIESEALRKAAELAMNRLLHRPLEEAFLTEDVSPGDTRFAGGDSPFARYLADDRTFGLFRDFLAKESVEASPELHQIDAGIAAQQRGLVSAKRTFYMPVVGVQGEIGRILEKDGEGVNEPWILSLLFKYPDNTPWDIGIKASLPIYAGGARKAAVGRAGETLEQLKLDREAIAEKIEQRVRSYALAARATNENIEQTRVAAEAAHKALDLVTDAYAQGMASLVELIDAQTAANASDDLAANAVYDFLINVMEVQRAANAFVFFMSDDDRHAWRERLENYFNAKR